MQRDGSVEQQQMGGVSARWLYGSLNTKLETEKGSETSGRKNKIKMQMETWTSTRVPILVPREILVKIDE
jgi:hypothetical protein